MDSRALHSLEFHRVLGYLAGFAASEDGFRACLSLRPDSATPLPEKADAASRMAALRQRAVLFEQGRLFALRTGMKLAPFAPLEGLLRFAASPLAVLDLEDLSALRAMLAQGKEKVRAIQEHPGAEEAQGWPLWVRRCRDLLLPAQCLAALNRCLSDEGLIRDEATPELALVREELRRLHQQCARKVKDYAAEYNILHFLQDSFMTLSSDRYVLPLKANFKGRMQGVIHDYSQTGETCYFEPLFLVEINNRLQNLKQEEREEERRVLAYLSALARDERESIEAVHAFLVELDLLFARAALADCFDGRTLELAEDRGLSLVEARHPLLALAASKEARRALRRHDLMTRELAGGIAPEDKDTVDEEPAAKEKEVVPSTLELLPGQKALIISGGNAGGKTVCLKSVGLIAAMALCALPVPVGAGSVMPPWRAIHAFIGDEQSLDDHVSTFTAQIAHIGRLWPALSPYTLVILDEFGAGTDPSQGAALAQALVDALTENGASVVAATHFPALKAYALSKEGVRAASVLFDPHSGKPLFRLVYDQVGASRALDVAREHGLPEEILRRAEQYLLVSGEDSSALVERLNGLAAQREEELKSLDRERKSFAEKKRRLEERFADERARLFQSVQAEAQKVLGDWKAAKVGHKQALKELARVRNALVRESGADEAANAAVALDLDALAPRQRLRHIPWKKIGTLLEVDKRKKRVRLDFDGVSLWADARDVAPAREGAAAPKAGGAGAGAFSSATLPLRLDLRGLRADVAIRDLEQFLDRAILAGREEVEIIHGRGTGVLRREVHGFLKAFPAVREYRLAPEDMGGDGMTMVELK
ncbi:MAG: Smr/MutS family protein [Desulfovibrio sp.]|jgi:DNA mismatch repair protein MutS2|nr:Smr/MutS family protein [Desulfovibrio sp.]